MPISVVGVDFKLAPVNVREQLALTHADVLSLLHTIHDERIFPEAFILSTCNRTEFYFLATPNQDDSLPHLLTHVAQIKNAAVPLDASSFFRYDGPQAVQHLFAVASSLESQIVGEHEILGQVKEAYRLACEARTAKFLFHKLLHWAFRASKRVMSETDLGQGTASVSQAAVDLAQHVFAHLNGKTALLVGAGQTAELAAQALIRAGVTELVIANRTQERARQLAESFSQWRTQENADPAFNPDKVTCPALIRLLEEQPLTPKETAASPLHVQTVSLEEIPAAIARTDLLISSTGATEPVLTHDKLAPALKHRRNPLLLIDIAVPRDIDPKLGELPNVYLYNIDGLQDMVEQNLQRRRQELPRAQAIVADEMDRFYRWLNSLGVVPTIKLLEQRFASLQQAEIERYHRKFTAADRQQLHEFARTLCAKILHDPIAFLRGLKTDGPDTTPLAEINTLRQIFNIESTEDQA